MSLVGFWIARNHNISDGSLAKLQAFVDDGPVFLAYDTDVNTLWHSEQAFRMDGNGLNHRIALEWVTLKFQSVNQVEALMLDNLQGDVTVNLRRKHRAEWVKFNGILQPVAWGNYDQWQGSFSHVEVEITELEEI